LLCGLSIYTGPRQSNRDWVRRRGKAIKRMRGREVEEGGKHGVKGSIEGQTDKGKQIMLLT